MSNNDISFFTSEKISEKIMEKRVPNISFFSNGDKILELDETTAMNFLSECFLIVYDLSNEPDDDQNKLSIRLFLQMGRAINLINQYKEKSNGKK